LTVTPIDRLRSSRRFKNLFQEDRLITLPRGLRLTSVSAVAIAAAFPLCAQASRPVAPTGRTVAISPTFEWTADADAVDYEIAIYNVNPSSPLYSLKRPQWHSRHAAAICDGTCRVVEPLWLEPGPYEWLVRASNAQGAEPWSARASFNVTGSAPDAPVPLSPKNTTVGYRPSYTWPAVPAAARYEVNASGSGVSLFVDADQCVEGLCSTTEVDGLYNGGQGWIVRAVSPTGDLGQWSAVARFTTAGSPLGDRAPAPSPLSPTGRVANALPTFRWTAAPGAINYHLDIFYGAELRGGLNCRAGLACDGSTCTATPIDPFVVKPTDSGRYTWRVRAVANETGFWSAPVEITLR
jgi:hypothetical protein